MWIKVYNETSFVRRIFSCKEFRVDKATVTGKGQVTLPRRIRERLKIEIGDKLLFDVEDGELRVRVVHGRGVGDLFAALPGVEVYAGDEAEREAMRAGFRAEQP